MSVIVGRARPTPATGSTGPSARRHAMNELGLDWNPGLQEVRRIVGDVIGKYHPHGDSAVSTRLVRMAQDFSLRYRWSTPGQLRAPSTAIPRRRCATPRRAVAHRRRVLPTSIASPSTRLELRRFEREPAVLPAKIRTCCLNGASGNRRRHGDQLPPHNLRELIDGCGRCSRIRT